MTKQMVGTVTDFDGRYFTVESPDAPAHLQTLHLVRGQMRGADVGDRVRLEYQTTASSGLWNVVALEPCPECDDTGIIYVTYNSDPTNDTPIACDARGCAAGDARRAEGERPDDDD